MMLSRVFVGLVIFNLVAVVPKALAQSEEPIAIAEEKQDRSRQVIVGELQGQLAQIAERRKGLFVEYEKALELLKNEREKLQAVHGESELKSAEQFEKLDSDFQSELERIRTKREKVLSDNDAKVAALEKELEKIQKRARKEYTDEISEELKANDLKRKAQEAAKSASLASVEDERIKAIDTYFQSLATHERNSQLALSERQRERNALNAEQSAKISGLEKRLKNELEALDKERAQIIQQSIEKKYALLEVSNRTVPPLVSQHAANAKGMTPTKTQTLEKVFSLNGEMLAESDGRLPQIQSDFEQLMMGNYVENFSFSDRGEVLYSGQVLSLQYRFKVAGIEFPLSPEALKNLEIRLISAVTKNLYLTPSENFRSFLFKPVDENGQTLSLKENPRVPKLMIALLKDRREELSGVTLAGEDSILIDGKKIKVQWFEKLADGQSRPLSEKSKEEDEKMQASWRKHIKRVLNPVNIPQVVREKLSADAKQTAEEAAASWAATLISPDYCSDFVFALTPAGILHVGSKQSGKRLFSATGVSDSGAISCYGGQIVLAAQSLQLSEGMKANIAKILDSDFQTAELVESQNAIECKDGKKALFVIAGGEIRQAIAAPEGEFFRVTTVQSEGKLQSFRAWVREEGGKPNTDYTVGINIDDFSPFPDIGEAVSPAELSVEVSQ